MMREKTICLVLLTGVLGIWACQPQENEESYDWDGDTDTYVDPNLDDAYVLPEVFDVAALADGSFGIVGQVGKVVTTFGSGENAVELSSTNKQDAIALTYGAEYDVVHQSQWGEAGFIEAATSIQQLADESLIIAGYGSPSYFMRKHAPDQTLVWETWIKGANHTNLRAAPLILSDQSLVVAGEFGSSTSFGDGKNQQTLNAVAPNNGFVARYSADGDLLWTQQIQLEAIHNVSVTTDDAIVVSGACYQSCSFNGQEVTLNVDIEEGYGAFLAEYGADGSLNLAKLIGEMDWDSGVMAIGSPDNAVYVGGVYNEFITLGQGTNQVTLTNPDQFRTPYLSKFSATGDLLWATSLDESYEIERMQLLPDGRIFLSGYQTDLGSTSSDSYSFSLISDENTAAITTKTMEMIGTKYSWPQAHFSGNALYFTGFYRDQIVFTCSGTSFTVENNTFIGAMFIAKVTLEGSIEWAGTIAGYNDSELRPPLID